MFRDQWIDPLTLKMLRWQVARTEGIDGIVVEVGSWEGRSAVEIAQAAYPRELHVVDHFQGSTSDGDISAALAAERGDIYEVFMDNIAEHTAGNVVVHRKSWQEWIAQEAPQRIAFAHLDAEHGYEHAKALIEAVLRLMAPGGVICGDDYHPDWDGTRRAVDELVPHRQVNMHAMWYAEIGA